MRALRAIATIAVAIALALTGVTTGAHADPPSGVVPAATDLVAVAAPTTQSLCDQSSLDYDAGKPPAHPLPPNFYCWDGAGSSPITAKAGCPPMPRPDGASADILALAQGLKTPGGNYCVDMVFTDRQLNANDPTGLDQVVYAQDLVAWSAVSGGNAVANLTPVQLKAIYSCNASLINSGFPAAPVTWNEVGGTSTDAIVPVLPQAASGTRSSWLTMLGIGTPPACVVNGTFNGAPIEENEGVNAVFSSASAKDVVFPYSGGDYVCQVFTKACPDVHGGLVLGNVNGLAPLTSSHTINITGYYVVYIRNLNVVTHGGSPTSHIPPYLVTFLGNGTRPSPGWICGSTMAADIVAHGFATTSSCGIVSPWSSGSGGGGSISGTVTDNAGAALAGVNVRICISNTNTCSNSVTSSSGFYASGQLADGSYQVYANAASYVPDEAGPITIAGGNGQVANLVLLPDAPLPQGVAIPGSNGGSSGPPSINWGQSYPLVVSNQCVGATSASFTVSQNGNTVMPSATFPNNSMTQRPSGTYTGTIPVFKPNVHGYISIKIILVCGGVTITIIICIYVDPSGNVLSPTGVPIAGATVTLLSASSANGPFTPVPNGSNIMSPANTTNPGITTSDGHFGWDTQPGYYEVQAQKPGCHTPTNPPAAIATTPVLAVPPPVTGLVLTLDCSGSPAPEITSADQATFTAGTGGSFTVTASGAPIPTLSETGLLPTGVTFTPHGDGTATLAVSAAATAQAVAFTATAANGVGSNASQAFTLTINPASGPVITSAPTASFTAGTSGTFTVTSTGTPTPTLSESGTLPTGVTFTAHTDGTATLTVGTGAAAGATTVTFTASSTAGPPAQQSFNLNILAPAPAITTPSSATFTLTPGTGGTYAVKATGSPTPALSESGTLPTGVTFTPNSNGTATLAVGTSAAPGNSTFTITAANGVSPNATQTFTLTVNPTPSAPPAPVITSAPSATFIAGIGGTFTVTSTGSPAPTLSESGTLPTGVTFTPNSNGTATLAVGTTAVVGTTTLTLTAANGVSPNATQTFTLTINPPAPTITSASSASFTAGIGGTFTVTSTGSPTPALSESGTLPTGVTFTPNSDGTATITVAANASTGTSTLTLTAANGVNPNATQTFTLSVN